jgi:DNA replication and repair protein RecF
MYLKQLSLVNYKNILQAEIRFSPKINCFIGLNGSGKTNILDAIYYLSYCKSHSNSIDNQNINHEADFFVIQGQYLINEKEEHIYCGLKRKQKKQFKRNKKEYERLSEHIGLLPLVLVSPGDTELISEGSDERRKFMDSIISQFDSEYLHHLIRYNNCLIQRNALLKDGNNDPALFDIIEEQMVEYAYFIYNKRKQFIAEFIPIFQQYYQTISEGKEKVDLQYISHLDKTGLKEELTNNRQRDTYLGYTSKGTHKDDLEMLLGDFPIKRTGSQGQNKTYLIALKLAQFDFLKKIVRFNPILLMDDIFDKLDKDRVKQIVKLVSEEHFGQIFITDTNREHLDEIVREMNQDALIFNVDHGEITLN